MYDTTFYKKHDTTHTSATLIAKLVYDLVNPTSVVDVGCGRGIWLKHFEQLGAETVTGIDGNWINRDDREIPEASFIEHDLEKPIRLDRTFDLVVSLECAEHLSPEVAERFVDSLVNLGDVILFSAAIPHQGGVHHVNEQWPEYWQSLFATAGFELLDCIRRPVWDKNGVIYYYAQNCFLFVRNPSAKLAHLRECSQESSLGALRVIHPNHYLQKIRYLEDPKTLSTLGMRLLLKALMHAIMARLGFSKSR